MGWTIDNNKEIVRRFLKSVLKMCDFELWKEYINDKHGNIAVYSLIGGGFIGNGFITISKDFDEAISLMKEVQPNRDWNMFEIEEFGEYTIVMD